MLEATLESFYLLETEKFDVTINLDRFPLLSSLSKRITSKKHYGFSISPLGKVVYHNKESITLFNINRYKHFRSVNQISWSEIYHNISQLEYDKRTSTTELYFSVNEKKVMQDVAHSFRLKYKKIIGMCVGSHKNDPQKRWPLKKFIKLSDIFSDDVAIVFIIGPDEKPYIQDIKKKMKKNYYIKYSDDIRKTIMNINLCDIVVSNDSLPLHISYSLNKWTVGLFGPDSPSQVAEKEILFKVRSYTKCVPCHSRTCKIGGFPCINNISVNEVADIINTII